MPVKTLLSELPPSHPHEAWATNDALKGNTNPIHFHHLHRCSGRDLFFFFARKLLVEEVASYSVIYSLTPSFC